MDRKTESQIWKNEAMEDQNEEFFLYLVRYVTGLSPFYKLSSKSTFCANFYVNRTGKVGSLKADLPSLFRSTQSQILKKNFI
jgi:hypothetical protein